MKPNLGHRLVASMEGARTVEYLYPWDGLEENLKGSGLPLIGYGSLLNLESAGRTIDEEVVASSVPVIAAGVTRIFNYVIPESGVRRYESRGGGSDTAALNLLYTPSLPSLINGRLFWIDEGSIPALRKREYGYDLLPVPYVPWNDATAEPRIAYVLVALDRVGDPRPVTSTGILPNLGYVDLCRAGARSVSSEFEEFFLETSFTNEGSSLREYLDSLEQQGD